MAERSVALQAPKRDWPRGRKPALQLVPPVRIDLPPHTLGSDQPPLQSPPLQSLGSASSLALLCPSCGEGMQPLRRALEADELQGWVCSCGSVLEELS